VAQSAALVDETIDLGDTMQLSEETERRRRSLEQSYDAAATPDLFDEARRQQVRCVRSLPRMLLRSIFDASSPVFCLLVVLRCTALSSTKQTC
jgi:hypothetical protein